MSPFLIVKLIARPVYTTGRGSSKNVSSCRRGPSNSGYCMAPRVSRDASIEDNDAFDWNRRVLRHYFRVVDPRDVTNKPLLMNMGM